MDQTASQVLIVLTKIITDQHKSTQTQEQQQAAARSDDAGGSSHNPSHVVILDACLVALTQLLKLDASLHSRAMENNELLSRIFHIIKTGLQDAQDYKISERGVVLVQHALSAVAMLSSVHESCRRVVVEAKVIPLIVLVCCMCVSDGSCVSAGARVAVPVYPRCCMQRDAVAVKVCANAADQPRGCEYCANAPVAA